MTQNNSRRDFIKSSSILAIGFSLPSFGNSKTIVHKIDTTKANALGLELNPYI
jgi:isoquinoline 1-oxidoreductase subunit beta